MLRRLDSGEVQILRSLRPLTHVTTPSGVAQVIVQNRNHVTVVEAGVVRVYERHEVEDTAAVLRGLGAHAYRLGRNIPGAIRHAIEALDRDLTAPERELVCDGWRCERAEVAL